MAGKNVGRFSAQYDTSLDRVSSTELHRHTKEALDKAQSAGALAVTQYTEVQGYLVAPERYEALLASEAHAGSQEQSRALLTMVMTAGLAGVAIPSETFEKEFPDVPVDWRAVAKFAAAYPITITHGQDGEPITRGRLSGYAAPVEDYGSDDDLDLG